jgi:hypothetical protein
MLKSIQHAQTGSRDDANIEDVDTVEPFKKFETINNNEIYMNDLNLLSLAFNPGEVLSQCMYCILQQLGPNGRIWGNPRKNCICYLIC